MSLTAFCLKNKCKCLKNKILFLYVFESSLVWLKNKKVVIVIKYKICISIHYANINSYLKA